MYSFWLEQEEGLQICHGIFKFLTTITTSLKTVDQTTQIDFISNFNQFEFIIKVFSPLVFFSFFHIIGLLLWIKNMQNISLKISLYPLTICFVPLLLHPYMRYFIPLIPITSVGFGFILYKNNFKKYLKKNKYTFNL